jgi:hypothetical protein
MSKLLVQPEGLVTGNGPNRIPKSDDTLRWARTIYYNPDSDGMGQCRLPYRLSDVRPRSTCHLGFEDRDGLPRYATFKERTCEGKICNPSLVDALEPRTGDGVSRLHRRSAADNNAHDLPLRRCTGEAWWRRHEAGRTGRNCAQGGREEVKTRTRGVSGSGPNRADRGRVLHSGGCGSFFFRTESPSVKASSAG